MINPYDEKPRFRWHKRHWKFPNEDIYPKNSSIFRPSKQISAETLKILYAGNFFVANLHDHGPMPLLQQKLAEANSLGKRRLILASVSELEHHVGADCHLGTLDNALPEEPWASILQYLTSGKSLVIFGLRLASSRWFKNRTKCFTSRGNIDNSMSLL